MLPQFHSIYFKIFRCRIQMKSEMDHLFFSGHTHWYWKIWTNPLCQTLQFCMKRNGRQPYVQNMELHVLYVLGWWKNNVVFSHEAERQKTTSSLHQPNTNVIFGIMSWSDQYIGYNFPYSTVFYGKSILPLFYTSEEIYRMNQLKMGKNKKKMRQILGITWSG